MKIKTPTKVELAMALADLTMVLSVAAGAAHYAGHAPEDRYAGDAGWRRCRRRGCTLVARAVVLHADAIEWAKQTAPPAAEERREG